MPDSSPLVSIIIPVYNGANYIAATLVSLMAQTFCDREIIVVDDGSTDDTVNIIKETCPSATILRQSNFGVSAARNYGVAMSKGQWIAFLDADDLWHSNRLQQLIDFTNGNPECLAIGTTAKKFCFKDDAEEIRCLGDWTDYEVNPTTYLHELVYSKEDAYCNLAKLIKKIDNFDVLNGNNILSTSVLIDKIVLTRAGMFQVQLSGVADYCCWMSVARLTQIWFIECPTVFYRVHSRSMIKTTDHSIPEMIVLVSQWYGGRQQYYPQDVNDKKLAAASQGYLSWLFREAVTKSIRNRCSWHLKAISHLSFFLLPQKQMQKALHMMIIKELIKTRFLGWRN